jgi:hypothetical protein
MSLLFSTIQGVVKGIISTDNGTVIAIVSKLPDMDDDPCSCSCVYLKSARDVGLDVEYIIALGDITLSRVDEGYMNHNKIVEKAILTRTKWSKNDIVDGLIFNLVCKAGWIFTRPVLLSFDRDALY